MNNKLTIKIFFTVICFGILAFFCGMLGAGPNGYAQQYELDINNDALINSIERLKRENTAFIPLQNYAETDSLDTLTSHFNVHFYYRDKNTIVYFFINGKQGNTGKSFINLVSVNQGVHQGNYKLINKDFDRNENLRVKKEFEERILKKLRFPYKDKGNGMFIFWK
jgi:hypothetical protein